MSGVFSKSAQYLRTSSGAESTYTPSRRTRPGLSISTMRNRTKNRLDLPEPVRPTIPIYNSGKEGRKGRITGRIYRAKILCVLRCILVFVNRSRKSFSHKSMHSTTLQNRKHVTLYCHFLCFRIVKLYPSSESLPLREACPPVSPKGRDSAPRVSTMQLPYLHITI